MGALPDFIVSRLPKTRSLLLEMSEGDAAKRLSAEEVCKRFEKEVRKELCRSSMRWCSSAGTAPCSGATLIATKCTEGIAGNTIACSNAAAGGKRKRGNR